MQYFYVDLWNNAHVDNFSFSLYCDIVISITCYYSYYTELKQFE